MDYLQNLTESLLSNTSTTTLMMRNITNSTSTFTDNKLTDGNISSSQQYETSIYIADIVIHMIVLTMGLFGNLITIGIMVKGQWGKDSTVSRYILLALAVSDSVMLLTHTFNQKFVRGLLGIDIRGLTNYGCKVFFVFYNSSKMTSSLFVVALCFDRFIAVMFPFRVKSIITLCRTKVFIILNYTLVIVFHAVFSFSTEVKNGQCKKGIFDAESEKKYRAMMLCILLLYTVIPIVTLSTFTPIIIINLYTQNRKRKALSIRNLGRSNSTQEVHQNQSLKRITTTLLSIVLAYIILVSPMAIYQQIGYWWGDQFLNANTNYLMFKQICVRLEQLNYSINFFLYICTCSKFRACVRNCLFGGLRQEHNTQTRTSRIFRMFERFSVTVDDST